MAQAKAVLAEAARLNDLAGEITGQVRGPLSVGCLQTFAQVLLPQLRRGFVDAFPQVEFRQAELNQTEIFEGLRGATLDVALIYDLDIPSDIFFLPLITLPPYAVLQADHPLARQTSVSPADLAPLPMVLLDLPFSTDYFLSVFTRAGLRPRIVERTRDMGVMRAMVANGFGYSIANIRPVTDQAPDGGRLAHVPLAGPVRPLQLGLAVMAGAGLALTVQAFVDHARATLTPGTA